MDGSSPATNRESILHKLTASIKTNNGPYKATLTLETPEFKSHCGRACASVVMGSKDPNISSFVSSLSPTGFSLFAV